MDLLVLDNQLESYTIDLRSHDEFKSSIGINNLSIKLVETKKHIMYPLARNWVKGEPNYKLEKKKIQLTEILSIKNSK